MQSLQWDKDAGSRRKAVPWREASVKNVQGCEITSLEELLSQPGSIWAWVLAWAGGEQQPGQGVGWSCAEALPCWPGWVRATAALRREKKLPQGSQICSRETFLNGSIRSSLLFHLLILPRSEPTVLIKIKSWLHGVCSLCKWSQWRMGRKGCWLSHFDQSEMHRTAFLTLV